MATASWTSSESMRGTSMLMSFEEAEVMARVACQRESSE
jgi:hypothetical protein